jgi:toxin ParE1/3/4
LTSEVIFLPAARAELISAQDWYERASPGLGARFRAEVDAQAERIGANALRFPIRFKDIRRARLRRFPYGLFFRVLPDAVYVIACFHASRDPMTWRRRG